MDSRCLSVLGVVFERRYVEYGFLVERSTTGQYRMR